MTIEEKKEIIGGVLVFLILYFIIFGNIIKKFDYIDGVYLFLVVVYLLKYLYIKIKK
ncbi:MAG TPA: hypothetical protein GX747_01905 [Tenericutes bacterium]|nr:hypothetical protein [Mycoplasmatota bacterium]